MSFQGVEATFTVFSQRLSSKPALIQPTGSLRASKSATYPM